MTPASSGTSRGEEISTTRQTEAAQSDGSPNSVRVSQHQLGDPPRKTTSAPCGHGDFRSDARRIPQGQSYQGRLHDRIVSGQPFTATGFQH